MEKKEIALLVGGFLLVFLVSVAGFIATELPSKPAVSQDYASSPTPTPTSEPVSTQILEPVITEEPELAGKSVKKKKKRNIWRRIKTKKIRRKTRKINKSTSTPSLKPTPVPTSKNSSYSGPVLTKSAGTVMGPSGKETYYNLDMSGVIRIMGKYGYSSKDYWVRGDGVKMLGEYVMIAADLNIRPRGSLVKTSLGTGLVCDTGGFAKTNHYQIDIAVNW